MHSEKKLRVFGSRYRVRLGLRFVFQPLALSSLYEYFMPSLQDSFAFKYLIASIGDKETMVLHKVCHSNSVWAPRRTSYIGPVSTRYTC
jgi:hypothetical protein